MNYWHMQLHPNNQNWGREKKLLEKKRIIGLGDWEEKRNQQDQFEKQMVIGDIVVVKRGKAPLAIVEIVGSYEYENNPDNLAWFQRRRNIKILDFYKKEYDFKISAAMGTLTKCSNLNTKTSKIIINWHNQLKK